MEDFEIISKAGEAKGLEELCTLAKSVRNPSSDGGRSCEAEEAIISAAMPIETVKKAIKLAGAFYTRTGKERTLWSYVKDRGVANKGEAVEILRLIKCEYERAGCEYCHSGCCVIYYGKAVIRAVLDACKKKGIGTTGFPCLPEIVFKSPPLVPFPYLVYE